MNGGDAVGDETGFAWCACGVAEAAVVDAEDVDEGGGGGERAVG